MSAIPMDAAVAPMKTATPSNCVAPSGVRFKTATKNGIIDMCITKRGNEHEVQPVGHFDDGIKYQTAYITNGMDIVVRLTWGSTP